jgi:hypothetical protein
MIPESYSCPGHSRSLLQRNGWAATPVGVPGPPGWLLREGVRQHRTGYALVTLSVAIRPGYVRYEECFAMTHIYRSPSTSPSTR